MDPPRTLKLTLAYDGTAYVGWQRQATGTSVQACLEQALTRLDGQPVAAAAAGRTDAGVHAAGQVVTTSLTRSMDEPAVARALNALLPDDIRVLAVESAPPGFHARYGARAKTYQYRIVNGGVVSPFERSYVWSVAPVLDVDAMAAAARRLEGRHDFASFQATGSDVRDTVRTITRSRFIVCDGLAPDGADRAACGWPRAGTGRLVVYEITGDGFLRHMVRTIVGTLVEVGTGRRPAASLDALLAVHDRAQAGATAPSRGLCLIRVEY